jgi:putative Ca2+/H+ antiporter (TMEM165/GDT1 family)
MVGASTTTPVRAAAGSTTSVPTSAELISWLSASASMLNSTMPLRSPAAASRSVSNTVDAAWKCADLSGPSKTTPAIQATVQASEPKPTGRWVLFISTFTTVFLAELGDKTQLATLLLSAQSGRPLLVFIGAALALVSTSLVGVLLGQWLSRHVPPRQLERLAGGLMLILGTAIGGRALAHLLPS